MFHRYETLPDWVSVVNGRCLVPRCINWNTNTFMILQKDHKTSIWLLKWVSPWMERIKKKTFSIKNLHQTPKRNEKIKAGENWINLNFDDTFWCLNLIIIIWINIWNMQLAQQIWLFENSRINDYNNNNQTHVNTHPKCQIMEMRHSTIDIVIYI